jgi:hypothetical protein
MLASQIGTAEPAPLGVVTKGFEAQSRLVGGDVCLESGTGTTSYHLRAADMPREPQNPDRSFSADGDPDENLEDLRYALDHSEPALPFNEAAKVRIGKVISGAVLKTKRRTQQKP